MLVTSFEHFEHAQADRILSSDCVRVRALFSSFSSVVPPKIARTEMSSRPYPNVAEWMKDPNDNDDASPLLVLIIDAATQRQAPQECWLDDIASLRYSPS
jgi:phosphohistidine phosphatase SixA